MKRPHVSFALALFGLACSSAAPSPGGPGVGGNATIAGTGPGGAPAAGASAGGETAAAGTSFTGGTAGAIEAAAAGNDSSGGSAHGGFGGSSGVGSSAAGSSAAGSSAAGSSGSNGSAGSGGAATGTPTFVAVGYAGRRIRSTDLGVTWTDNQTLGGGGDDEFLLRAVTFGKGVFVALGWKILTSSDAKNWQPQTNPNAQWLGGAVFANGRFVATGGFGYSATSIDGISWATAGDVPKGEASRSLAFGMSEFVTATDPGNWYHSSDGSAWTLLSGGHATSEVDYCNGAFSEASACSGAFNGRGRATALGTTIRLQAGKLERSINGKDFSPVAGSPDGLEDVCVGYVQ